MDFVQRKIYYIHINSFWLERDEMSWDYLHNSAFDLGLEIFTHHHHHDTAGIIRVLIYNVFSSIDSVSS
jgi:hypothetical protein